MMGGNGQVSVPPGFRFHPTDEELLCYYLRKKVSYEPIDLDVIKEVDLNKLEPWDLKDKCAIGSGPQNEWYFFSHKDKKYPTGTRTNRATAAGFWKATGRDKAVHHTSSKTIGMRKTLVFYTGRAPHGHKTDWIMHEYRLHDDVFNADSQEDGWVVCRVFKKKPHTRGFHPELDQEDSPMVPFNAGGGSHTLEQKQNSNLQHFNNYTFDHGSSMHLPQLLSPGVIPPSLILSSTPLNAAMDVQSTTQNLLRLASGGAGASDVGGLIQPEKLSGDWSFLDKLLATHPNNMDRIGKCPQFNSLQGADLVPQGQRFPFPYLGFEPDFSRFPK